MYVGDIPEFDVDPPAALGMFPVLIDRRRAAHGSRRAPASRTWRICPGSSMGEAERRFTPAEANAELADLRERLPRLRDARRALIRSSERITEAVAADGGRGGGERLVRGAADAEGRGRSHLAERGILLRDPETGLVDFPGEIDGRPRVPVLAAR